MGNKEYAKRLGGALAMALLWVFCFLFVMQFIFAHFSASLPGPLSMNGGLTWTYILERLFFWGVLPALMFASAGPRAGAAMSMAPAFACVTALDTLLFFTTPLHSMHEIQLALFAYTQTVALCVVVLPAGLFFRWTLWRRYLMGRLTLHFIYYAILLLLVIPSLVFVAGGNVPGAFLEREAWLNRILLQFVFPAGILGWTAARELALRGGGSPMPWDPPLKLTTTGPYAFLRDPLRLAKTGVLVAWAIFLGNPWVAAAAMVIPLYALTFARYFEQRELQKTYGEAWLRYRENVHAWWPRWSPWRDPDAPPAILRIDSECGACSALGQWFQNSPGLSIACIRADGTGELPERPVYDPGSGDASEEGIGALARALEHRNLGFAFIGWCMRMPLVRPILQLIFDAVTEKTPRLENTGVLDAQGTRGENAQS